MVISSVVNPLDTVQMDVMQNIKTRLSFLSADLQIQRLRVSQWSAEVSSQLRGAAPKLHIFSPFLSSSLQELSNVETTDTSVVHQVCLCAVSGGTQERQENNKLKGGKF